MQILLNKQTWKTQDSLCPITLFLCEFPINLYIEIVMFVYECF